MTTVETAASIEWIHWWTDLTSYLQPHIITQPSEP